jgi:hypothetical protein
LEGDLGISIDIKTSDDSNQLSLEWLMTHFLQEDSYATLGEIVEALLIYGLEGSSHAEVRRRLKLFL